jgi:tRNA threonylcarbamoyladenosine biosynthesis protein TsaB
MRILALDTTTRAGSVALVEDDRVIDERPGDGALTHALRMPAEVLAIAEANGWPIRDIDLFAVASGPGSFTGLRIGIATIQGLALVHGRRVVAVPILDALAHAAAEGAPAGTVIGAWMDAHRGDVFASIYRTEPSRDAGLPRLIAIEGPTVGPPAATLERWRGLAALPATVAGDGAAMYPSEIAAVVPDARIVSPACVAGVIGRLAFARASEASDPASVRPLYVRRPAVELARDEKLRHNQLSDNGH